MDLANLIRAIPDFPIEGILFRDITTMLNKPEAFKAAIDALVKSQAGKEVAQVVAIESRGYIFGGPMAYQMGAGLTLVRKPGKLPAETVSVEYSLEYGTNILEMHADAFEPGTPVVVVDDLLATGGSAKAAIDLVEQIGGVVVGVVFLIALDALGGAEKLADYDVFSLIHY